ncbi:unnamed protein product [Ixodes pacificus]
MPRGGRGGACHGAGVVGAPVPEEGRLAHHHRAPDTGSQEGAEQGMTRPAVRCLPITSLPRHLPPSTGEAILCPDRTGRAFQPSAFLPPIPFHSRLNFQNGHTLVRLYPTYGASLFLKPACRLLFYADLYFFNFVVFFLGDTLLQLIIFDTG